ncbi:MAG TPA: heparinase II/III family protein [Planctomycetota bacterium]|jgi:hypothetical protein
MMDVPYNDQRTVTDEQFLDGLKLPGKAGQQLAAARRRGDIKEARRLVASHFRSREKPRWPFYMHGTAWTEINGRGNVIEKADALFTGEFRNSWPPFDRVQAEVNGKIDWKVAARVGGRTTWLPELSTAFALTGETKYLRRAMELMKSFVEGNPFVLEEGFHEDHDRYFGGPNNNTLCTFLRSARWIDFMYCGALQAGVINDEDVFWLVKQLWFYAMQYYRYCGDEMRGDNHHLGDHGLATFYYAVAFPEFSVAKALLKQAVDTIQFHAKRNMMDDGGYAEHSTKYQYHITYGFLSVAALAKANDIRLFTRAEERKLAAWVEFNVRACKPDGVLSEFGDEFGGSLAMLLGTLAAPVMNPPLAAMSRALGYEPGEMLSETAAELQRKFKNWKAGAAPRVGLSPWFAGRARERQGDGETGGRGETARAGVGRQDAGSRSERCESESQEPRAKSQERSVAALPQQATKHYPQSGYTFFRSAWDASADFLAVSHMTDMRVLGHSHADFMSFILHTQRKTLLGDPATWLYTDDRMWSPQHQELRGYLYHATAHNCMLMNDDGLKPLAALGHLCNWHGHTPPVKLGLFKAGGLIEVLECRHDAYAPHRHRRFVLHLAGIGFAFVDLWARPELDLRPNQYSQLLHAEGGVEMTPEAPENGGTVRLWSGRSNCFIVPGAETETTWNCWRDEKLCGVYGISKNGGWCAPPWVAQLTRRQEGPSVFSTFLVTQPSASLNVPPVARYLGAKKAKAKFKQHDGLSANVVDLGATGSLWLASCPYGKPLESKEMSTDAELAVAIVNKSGRVEAWAAVRGSHFSLNGEKLLKEKAEWAAGTD